MKKFTTETGSVYEVDEANKKIRRLGGNKEATNRQGKDGEWKAYSSLYLSLGESALIMWTSEVKPMFEGMLPATETSYVINIEEI